MPASKWSRFFEAENPLVPNCLLTRRPIVFISSHTQRLSTYPQRLREHGYDVRIVDASGSFRRFNLRLDKTLAPLSAAHFFIDTCNEFYLSLPENFKATQTHFNFESNYRFEDLLQTAVYWAEHDLSCNDLFA